MAEYAKQWLTTGGVAKLCSVRPDTVQKWIRKGRIPAQRTAGGHYRVALPDVEPFLTGLTSPRWYRAPPDQCRPQPLRCWEYLSDNGTPREECTKCVVYRVRAAWCFEVLGTGVENSHSRQFCRNQDSCQDCLYYRRVRGAAVRVLVVTADHALVERLGACGQAGIELTFAANSYQTSRMIGEARPDLVILDEELCECSEPNLLKELVHESRVPGLKIALCGAHRELHTSPREEQAILARLQKPFDSAAIAALLDSMPVERRTAYRPRRGTQNGMIWPLAGPQAKQSHDKGVFA